MCENCFQNPINSFKSDQDFGSFEDKLQRDTLKEFEKELIEDYFLEFGLIFNTDTELTEIYILNSNYIQIWGNDKTSFVQIIEKNGIQQKEHLNIRDEFPKVRTVLTQLNLQAKSTNHIIDALRNKFIDREA